MILISGVTPADNPGYAAGCKQAVKAHRAQIVESAIALSDARSLGTTVSVAARKLGTAVPVAAMRLGTLGLDDADASGVQAPASVRTSGVMMPTDAPAETLLQTQLDGCRDGAAALAVLQQCPALAQVRSVTLNHLGLTSTDLEPLCAVLAAAPRLTRLALAHNQLDDAAMAALGRLAELRVLDLRDNGIGDGGLQILCDHLEQLVSLRLARNAVTDAGLQALRQHRRLQDLDLRRNSLTDAAAQALLQVPQLKVLELRKTQMTPAGREAVAQLPGLQALDLW